MGIFVGWGHVHITGTIGKKRSDQEFVVMVKKVEESDK